MANINSLMSSTASNTSSLYGTRNVLSGLASGMDTEAMIENSVSGYKARITQLQQEQTKYQWKQDAYRGITDKMYDLTQKYTSYTSKTNLMSNAFFNNSISTTVSGPDGVASKVSATGRSSSDIQLLAAQAATAASYSVSASNLGLNVSNTATGSIEARANDTLTVGTLKGTMTINYDGKKIDLTFDETDKIDGTSKTLADAITEKLENTTVNTGYGTQKASELINVGTDSGGNITFSDKGNRGANPYVSYLDSSMKTALGATDSPLYTGSSDKKYTFAGGDKNFVDNTKTVADYLSGKDISVTVDGVTKTFRLDKDTIKNSGIRKAFIDGIDGLNMGLTATDSESNQLSFSAGSTSNFSISVKDEEAARLLGLDSGISNYLDTKSTIGNLLGSNYFTTANAAKTTDATIVGEREGTTDFYTNADTGIRYKKVTGDGTDVYYRVDSADKQLYELKINNKSIYVSKDASLESVLEGINNSDMGVKASFSKLTGSFVFTAKETGASGAINFGSGLAARLFTADGQGTRTNGTDATVRALVNGELTTLTRASNTIDMDGMKVTLNGSFNEDKLLKDENGNYPTFDTAERANALSFNTSAGSDDLMKTITDFVNDYNTVLKQLHDAYATQPAEKNSSSHTRYEPLTDDDKSGMSEKAIENYETKAKQGILFGDSDLRAAYEALVRAVSPGGNDGAALRNMGIETTYSGGLTQIKLNESKLRDALAQDPDSVRDAFTKSKEYGASSDGLMTSIKETMDRYSSTSIASPGILVKKAGSTYSSSSLLSNAVQSQIDSVQKKIEQWQSKMSSKIDYYTRQFTALEKLMNTMNSQSSALAGLMGG